MRLKKLIYFLILIIVIVIVYFQVSLKAKLPILTGYAAKMACSCTFVANRDLESIESEDLDFFPINLATVSIDYTTQSATANFLGMSKQVAFYTAGKGCALVHSEKPVKLPNHKIEPPSDTLSFAFHQIIQDSSSSLDLDALKASIDLAFDKSGSTPKQKTRAVIVLHKGQLVGESYGEGIDKNTLLLGWSMTKSIINALIGILVQKGKINVKDEVHIAKWKEDSRNQINIDHLLNMESGLEWNEDYFNISDVTRMLYMEDFAPGVAISKPLEFNPEENWKYSSGTSNILSWLIRQNCESYHEYINFPYQELFYKIGMTSARMEVDANGNFIGSSYCFATARDWAKFGLLFLNDGIWNGERLLPEGWVEYSKTPVPKSNGIYGAHFWLNDDRVVYADAPGDLFSANGFQGQRVFIIPSKDLVIVRLGLADSRTFDFNGFLKNILQHFPEK